MLQLKGVTKRFPGVVALKDVSVEFLPGEIHALLGENGAGKSTLMKIICGIHQPSEGTILLNDDRVQFRDFNDAINHQISIVNQEIQVIPMSSIAENIVLDKIKRFTHNGKVDWGEVNCFAKKYLDMVGLDIPPTTTIGQLSAAQKQLIQIAKGLAADAKLLLLDEPTSSLTQKEANVLIKIVKKLKEDGVAIIFVSHKIEEVMELCDKITVLRDGEYIGTEFCHDITKQQIITMMIGRETEDKFLGHLDIDQGEKVLEVKALTQKNRFKNLNFHLNKGEILGFYGLVGSGRTELAKIIIGEDTYDSGEIYINGKKAKIKSMADSLHKYQLGYVSENRKEEGLILSETIQTNIAVTIWNKIVHRIFRFIEAKKECTITEDMIQKLSIKTPSSQQQVGLLSGGNQQKVSISKWLAADCDILIIDEPSVGVDIGAKEYIHQLIWDLAKVEGKSIIVISSDMPEIITLARRLLIFKDFQIIGEINDLNGKEYDYEHVSNQIGQYLA